MAKTMALLPKFYLKGNQASLYKEGPYQLDPKTLSEQLDHNGADGIVLIDCSGDDKEHDAAIGISKEIARNTSLDLYMGGNIRRLEDVKKYIYAGAKQVWIHPQIAEEQKVFSEAVERFGGERVTGKDYETETILLKNLDAWIEAWKPESLTEVLILCCEDFNADFYGIKQKMKQKKIPVFTYEPRITWEQFRLNTDGLMPVVVQDYRTGEVLMVAYMNEAAFQETVETGKMCYYSRSRQERWLKGETSGHYQYVKALYLDCDNDTILAKVAQVGAACHTGSYSCFFQEILDKHADAANPHKVLEQVYDVIKDRKIHPKEGSYTNYLFDKGIDKILKKCGEEATEIIIAAKNPDPEEIKYEISDFLYHVMVLMAEKQVTWEDIMRELANR